MPYKKMRKTGADKYYLSAFIAVLTFAIYLPSLQNEFIFWDDDLYIFENPFIRSFGIDFLRWAFFDFHAGNWHPLTWISHAIDYSIWGLNPMGHHLTSNIIHAVNTLLVVLLVARFMEARSKSPSPSPSPLKGEGYTVSPTLRGGDDGEGEPHKRGVLIAAATTGILFGIHPLHVESVAWVSERKDLLCAMFFLLSIMMYLKYSTTPKISSNEERGGEKINKVKWYLLSLLFFILALLSKPMAVTLPVVLLILDWYPLRKIDSLKTLWTEIINKIPFFFFSLISSVLTVFAQQAGSAIRSSEVPFLTRILVAVKSLIDYLRDMILPLDLSPFYPYPEGVSFLSTEYFSAVLLVGGITIASVGYAKKQTLWLSVWGYYLVTLLPVLGIIQVGLQSRADRYTYLPSLGPFLVAGVIAAWAWARSAGPKGRVLSARVLIVAAAAIVITLLSYSTIQQTGIWRDGIVFWSRVIEKEPEAVPFAYYNRAISFERTGQIDKAIADYDKAIDLYPYYHAAYNNRGMAFKKTGQIDKAISDFDRAIAINPDQYIVYNNRAIAFEKAGLFDKAVADYEMAIAVNPSYYEAYYNLGLLSGKTAQFEKGIENFSKAILLNPENAVAYVNRGVLHIRSGNKQLAFSDFQKACQLGNQDGCRELDEMMKS
jgi:protein O-mannosyl-transferase